MVSQKARDEKLSRAFGLSRRAAYGSYVKVAVQ
jgi:hypothetical protein